jgi:hypothetical protein
VSRARVRAGLSPDGIVRREAEEIRREDSMEESLRIRRIPRRGKSEMFDLGLFLAICNHSKSYLSFRAVA